MILGRMTKLIPKGGDNMANGCGCQAPVAVSPIINNCMNSGFLILLLLFILLACSCGREQNFFFIIILAIIAFGGFGRTFGYGGGGPAMGTVGTVGF